MQRGIVGDFLKAFTDAPLGPKAQLQATLPIMFDPVLANAFVQLTHKLVAYYKINNDRVGFLKHTRSAVKSFEALLVFQRQTTAILRPTIMPTIVPPRPTIMPTIMPPRPTIMPFTPATMLHTTPKLIPFPPAPIITNEVNKEKEILAQKNEALVATLTQTRSKRRITEKRRFEIDSNK